MSDMRLSCRDATNRARIDQLFAENAGSVGCVTTS